MVMSETPLTVGARYRDVEVVVCCIYCAIFGVRVNKSALIVAKVVEVPSVRRIRRDCQVGVIDIDGVPGGNRCWTTDCQGGNNRVGVDLGAFTKTGSYRGSVFSEVRSYWHGEHILIVSVIVGCGSPKVDRQPELLCECEAHNSFVVNRIDVYIVRSPPNVLGHCNCQ